MNQCPKCKSDDIHRSRLRTKWETWRKAITEKRPYRCHACEWRGWSIDMGPKRGTPLALAEEPVMAIDLAHLDSLGTLDKQQN